VIELATWDQIYSGSGKPGNFGFDPLGFSKGKSAADIKTLELKEIKNGNKHMNCSINMYLT